MFSRPAQVLLALNVLMSSAGFGQSPSAGSGTELSAQQAQRAIAQYKATLAADPNNLNAHANLGVIYFFSADFSNAVDQLHAALKIQPNIPKLIALLGMSEKRLGDIHEAQADLAKAFPLLTEDKLRVDAGLELIEVDYALQDLGKAAEVVNVLRQLKPTDADILYTAHRIYADLADETTLALAMTAPHSARMEQLMAHELARRADNQAAIDHYRIALKLDPNRADIHYELAEMLYSSSSTSDQAEAEKEYRLAIAGNPYDEKSISRLGDLALKRSNTDSALQYFTRAYHLQPDDPDANLGLARVLMSLHEPAKAEPHLERAIQIEPYNAISHYRLGIVYRELGKQEQSRQEMAQFEKLKKMKNDLQNLYQAMRLQPGKNEPSDSTTP